MKKNIIFVITAVFLFFFLIESSLRLILFIYEDPTKVVYNEKGNPLFKAIPDDYLGYKMNPESSVPGILEINSFGYRGGEVTIKKPANTYRIITLGGSSTAGYHVWPKFTYPAILEHLLKNNPPVENLNYEVINGGVGGYTSIQAYRSLVRDLIKFDPDLVIWMSGWNDLQQSFNVRWYPDILKQKKIGLSRFAIYKVYKRFLERLHLIPKAKTQYESFNQKALIYYKKNTEKTITFLKEKDVDIWLLSLPIAYSRKDPQDKKAFQIAFGDKKTTDKEIKMTLLSYEHYLDAMKELSSQYDIPLVNAGISENMSGKRYFFTDILHPNNSGNKVIAYNLYKHVAYGKNFYNSKSKSVFNDFWDAELVYGNFDNNNDRFLYLENLALQLKGIPLNNKKSMATLINEFVINLIKTGALEYPYVQKHLFALLQMGRDWAPEYPLTYFVNGKILKDMQNLPEAEKLFSLLSLVDKEFDVEKALNTPVQVNKSWKFDHKSFKNLFENIQFHPDLPIEKYFINLSRLFGMLKDYDLGIYYAKKASINNPRSIKAKWNLMVNLFLSGQLDKALYYAEELNKEPDPPKLLTKLLKEIYLEKGLKEKAKKLSVKN